MFRKLAISALLTTAAGIASATPSPDVGCNPHHEDCTKTHPSHPVRAPEIEAASAVAGLTFMIGGLAVLRGRRSKITVAKN
jgi:hypothetical protein